MKNENVGGVKHIGYIMKKLLSFLFVLFVLGSVYAAEPDSLLFAGNAFRNPINREDCTCKGKPVEGLVDIVEYNEDFKVCVVESSPDLKVRVNKSYKINDCGNWTFTNGSCNPEFTIRFVEDEREADFTIKFED